jgi:hypothetical protein
MWFSDIDIVQRYPSMPQPVGGVAPSRRDLAVHAYREHQLEHRLATGRKVWRLLIDALIVRSASYMSRLRRLSNEVPGRERARCAGRPSRS